MMNKLIHAFGLTEFGHDLEVIEPNKLNAIRKCPEINLILYKPPIERQALDYLSQLNMDTDFSHVPCDRGGVAYKNIKFLSTFDYDLSAPLSAEELIETKMSTFPKHEGLRSFAQSVLLQAELFCRAAESSGTAVMLMQKGPQIEAVWHADNETDLRALVTWKGEPTFWLPNQEVVDWSIEKRGKYRHNFYGLAGTDFLKVARQARVHELVVMQGHMHNPTLHIVPSGTLPIIHTEPVLSQTSETRLIQLMNL